MLKFKTHIRVILLSAILVFVSLPSRSQLRYGFRFGGDFASVSLKNTEGYSIINKSGFSGGLMLEYQFEKCGFATDIAVVYGRHSATLKSDGQDNISYGRNFIDIPLHLKYKFWLKSTYNLFAPMVYTGPIFSFRLDHNNAIPMTTKFFQPGWDVGIGFDIINFIQITGGYRFGLSNAVKEFIGRPQAELHTNGWNVAATLLFDF